MLDSIVKVITGKVKLRGNTDGTLIGNDGDKLKVTATLAGVRDDVLSNKLYSFGVSVNMAVADAENGLILFKNPSGSGKVAFIYRIQAGVNVTNVRAEFKVFGEPTTTSNGTALSEISRNVGGGSGAAAITAFSLPTVTASGNQIANLIYGQNNNSVISADDFSLAIQPGFSILLTGGPGSNNRLATTTFIWLETAV